MVAVTILSDFWAQENNSSLFPWFPHSLAMTFIVMHTVKSFRVVNEAEVDVFLESSCFFYDPADAGNLFSGSSAFTYLVWTSGSSWFMYCWSLAWRRLSITLLASEMSTIMWKFEQYLALPFFGIGMKTGLFQCCGHCWVFQICWHIECNTFTVSSFRIEIAHWNSITCTSFVCSDVPKAHPT